MAERGVRRGLELMRQWAGGVVCQGLVDDYPLPPVDPAVEITPADVRRWLGIELNRREIAEILQRLEFEVRDRQARRVRASTPDHRLDIGAGVDRRGRPDGGDRPHLRLRAHPRDAHGGRAAAAARQPDPGEGGARARPAGRTWACRRWSPTA